MRLFDKTTVGDDVMDGDTLMSISGLLYDEIDEKGTDCLAALILDDCYLQPDERGSSVIMDAYANKTYSVILSELVSACNKKGIDLNQSLVDVKKQMSLIESKP